MEQKSQGAYQDQTVKEVKKLAREWVEKNYLGKDGFVGAHLVGSINHTPEDELFPLYKDVDIAIILETVDYQEIVEISHQGYILECILSGATRYKDAKGILSLPGMACNLEVDSVLVDPNGTLATLHEQVRRDYNKREYVQLRVENENAEAKKNLQGMSGAGNALEFVFFLGNFIMNCSAMPTVAHLQPPTHRRGLLNLKPFMVNDGQEDLYGEYLKVFGSYTIDEPSARLFIDQAANVFDRALAIKKSPVPYEWKLDPCIRPYLVEGSLEMIREGGHRESIFWIALFFMISNSVIQQDGTEEEKVKYTEQISVFIGALGLSSAEKMADRVKDCGVFLEKLTVYTRQVIKDSEKLR